LRRDLVESADAGYVLPDVPGTVVLYCASEQAVRHIAENLHKTGLGDWSVRSTHMLPLNIRVTYTNSEMADLACEYYDASTNDKHKGPVPLGFSDCALPLVLAHNTPNNSICPLWMDTRDDPDSLKRRALFPRYERHHPDRP
jgi:hypothetical protein